MIKLIDLIKLSNVTLGKYKIHCATGINNPPIEAFFDGKFQQWQEEQNHENFKCDNIISLIHLENDKWLFAGVYKILGVEHRPKDKIVPFKYAMKEIKEVKFLSGCAIIQFNKNFRASYLIGEKYIDRLAIREIRGEKMTIGDFPGYNSVLLSHKMLRTVIREQLPSWKSALSNVSGVYIITDNSTGKHYVGSAYGGKGIWQRWQAYANSQHGGNNELKKLLKTKPDGYVFQFQYSILEVCDLNSKNEYIIGRETHWKNVIGSRKYGYNSN